MIFKFKNKRVADRTAEGSHLCKQSEMGAFLFFDRTRQKERGRQMAVTISIQEKAFEHEGRKTPVLNDIELSIASGEFLTVIGPAGPHLLLKISVYISSRKSVRIRPEDDPFSTD